ncbi:MAG: hypothetical protein RIA72_05555 [Sphingopyxis sp.]|uniref:hypothetical protein n=1 Tax=Sphingopyxis sp. TaxID=1908224 RepID=UPI0032EAD326
MAIAIVEIATDQSHLVGSIDRLMSRRGGELVERARKSQILVPSVKHPFDLGDMNGVPGHGTCPPSHLVIGAEAILHGSVNQAHGGIDRLVGPLDMRMAMDDQVTAIAAVRLSEIDVARVGLKADIFADSLETADAASALPDGIVRLCKSQHVGQPLGRDRP